MTALRALLHEIGDRISRIEHSTPLTIGIDGVDASGKTIFADQLAEILDHAGREVIRSTTDNFHNPRSHRYRQGEESPEGFYEDSFNYESMRRFVLDPLRRNGSRRCVLSAYDHVSDSEILAPELTVSNKAILVFDGIFLMRSELRQYWDFSIFLRVSFAESTRRTLARDFVSTSAIANSKEFMRRHNARYVAGQRIYFDRVDPESLVDLVVDNEDPMNPSIA